jgi:putative DNA primase/helicase
VASPNGDGRAGRPNGLCTALPDSPRSRPPPEKAADAAARLLPGFAVVTSPNGSKSAGKADWSPLRGRAVTVWPDADAAGLEYTRQVAKVAIAVGAVSVGIVSPPPGVKVGWDAADAEADGWDQARAVGLVTAAVSTEEKSKTTGPGGEVRDDEKVEHGGASPGGRRRTPQRDVLIGLTEFCELWHDANRTAYASFPVNEHLEHWPIRSRDFRMWLSGRFFKETGGAIGGQALEDGLRILEARAVNEGPQHEPFLRVGHRGGNAYIDLCDTAWRAVEITTNGWRLIEKPPLKLLRSPSMRPLPEPVAGSLIEEYRHHFGNLDDDDLMLVFGFIVAALRNRGPFPVLGEQGAGKSVFSGMVRSLVDPSAAPIRAMPKDDRDLLVSANNSWMMAYDNLSSVPAWFSDALCRLATGGGFATRMLHTDREEMIFEATRPIILNGIPTLTDRADLADRAITIHLRSMPEDQRKPEDELLAAFETDRPCILGALLDAVSAAVRNIAAVRLERSPRMADFVKWVTAAAPGLGWEPGAFLAAYQENRRDISESVFEADAVAVAIATYVMTECPNGWEGTSTALLAEINNRTSEGVRKSRSWPQNASQLGNRVARAKPLLTGKGFKVERRHSGTRTITIVPPKA